MVVNDVYKVKIEKLDHKGRGITHIDGKIVFVTNALPDEEVDIRITAVKKKLSDAVIVKHYKEAKSRVGSVCTYYKECGGCDLLHMKHKSQIKFKELKVKEIMEKFAGVKNTKIKPILFSDNVTYYRNKITLKINDGKIGFYQKKSNRIAQVEACKNANPKINDILYDIKNYMFLDGIEEIIIRVTESLNQSMVVIIASEPVDDKRIRFLLEEKVDTIVVKENDKSYLILGKGYITEQIGDYKYKISPDSFFQVNSGGAKIIFDKVLEYADLTGKESVLDLFCGTGVIGIYLSKCAKEIIGIEINRSAVADAMYNQKINDIKNAYFVCKNVTKVNEREQSDIVVVDPPRAGLEKRTIDFLIKSTPKKIIYVSCDPVTLARDLKLLEENYMLKEITPIDMFPGTSHVECVSLLCLK
jgi:23S rRNA (uracil-5-)-methyltransferase RumA